MHTYCNNHLPFLIWWKAQMHVVEETAEDQNVSKEDRYVRTKPSQSWSPTLEIETRDLFCFCLFFVCLFACLFFFKSSKRNFFVSLHFHCIFFSWKCPVSPRFRSCMTWCNNNWFSTLLTIEPPVVRASALELWGWLVPSLKVLDFYFFLTDFLITWGQYSNFSLCYSASSLFYKWSFPF